MTILQGPFWKRIAHFFWRHKWIVLGVLLALVAGVALGYEYAAAIIGAAAVGALGHTQQAGGKLAKDLQQNQANERKETEALTEKRDQAIDEAKKQADQQVAEEVKDPAKLAKDIDQYLKGRRGEDEP